MFPSPKTPASPLASSVKRLYHSAEEGSITLSTTARSGLQFDLGDGFDVERRGIFLIQHPVHGAVHAPAEVLQVHPPVGVRVFLELVEGQPEAGPRAPEI